MTTDLEWLFSPAGNLESAQKVFADRIPEHESFIQSLDFIKSRAAEYNLGNIDVQNVDDPRKNVLHYFGFGGIGKSELLSQFEKYCERSENAPQHWSKEESGNIIFTAYDFANHQSPSPEGFLLSIRQMLTSIKIKCIAFDLLMSRYWLINHPGKSIDDYLRSATQLRKTSDEIGLSSQMEASLGEIATELAGAGIGISGSALIKLSRKLVGIIAERGAKSSALSECARLREMLSAPADISALPFYASALAWDISRAKEAENLSLVVFADHLEDMSEAVERIFQTIVWMMPNVLFVTCGRSSLKWTEPRSTWLFRSGQDRWPNLTPGAVDEPRQHRVGALSLDDCEHYLDRALPEHRFSQTELSRISAVSGGFPYHLDLLVQHWAELPEALRANVEELLVPFPELARRVLRGLTPDERRVVYSALLFDSFEAKWIGAISSTSIGLVRALFRRPMFVPNACRPDRVSLDRTLRQAMLALASEEVDGWNYDDWVNLANTALQVIRTLITDSDIDTASYLLSQAFKIANSFSIQPDWMVDAAIRIALRGRWEASWSVEPFGSFGRSESAKKSKLSEGLEIVFQRQGRNRKSVSYDLRSILAGCEDDRSLDILRYYLAEALRDCGEVVDSSAVLAGLEARNDELGSKSIHAKIHLLRRQGNIRKALNELDKWRDILPSPERLEGEILWTQGQFESAEKSFREGAAKATKAGVRGEEWMCRVYTAFNIAWREPERALNELEEADHFRPDFTTSFTDGIELLTIVLARPSSNLLRSLDDTLTKIALYGQSSLFSYTLLSYCFVAVSRGFRNEEVRELISFYRKQGYQEIPYVTAITMSFVEGAASISGFNLMDEYVAERWLSAIESRAGWK